MMSDETYYFEEKQLNEVTVAQLDQLALDIFNQRSQVDLREEELKRENKKLEELQSKMVELLELFGRTNYDLPGVGKLTVVEQPHVALPSTPEDKDAFFSYLQTRGIFNDLVSVNSRTLNSFYKREREIAREEGRSIEFSIPGLNPPKTRVTMRVSRGN